MQTGLARGQFTSPHGIAVDGHGNIYVAELSARVWARISKEPTPKRLRVIHKLVKVYAGRVAGTPDSRACRTARNPIRAMFPTFNSAPPPTAAADNSKWTES